MSLNRENTAWQVGPDGTWSIGFWAFEYHEGEDIDHEWDVDYSDDAFWWVSTGYASPEAATDAYQAYEGNTGGCGDWLAWSEEYAEEITRLEEMAQEFVREHGDCGRPSKRTYATPRQ